MEFLGYIITGGVAAAVVKLIESLALWRLNRKAKKEDDSAEREEKEELERKQKEEESKKVIAGLQRGQCVILRDRIKYLGRCYLKAKEIDLDDRQDLIDMHSVYHNDLGGNGNLDRLMEEVMKLPLTK